MPQTKTLPSICLALLAGLQFLLGAGPVLGAPSPVPPPAAGLRDKIVAACGGASVVIVGERHRQPQSHALFLDLVETFVARGERVAVGLEIGADRQTELDAALAGRGPCRGVASPPIESDSYQELIRSLGRLTRLPGARVRVVALDARREGPGERDAAMASRVTEVLRRNPTDRVLVLVGNLHALKTIPWSDPEHDQRLMLAGLLVEEGVKVVSFVQRFPSAYDATSGAEFHPAGAEVAAAAVCEVWGCLRTDPSLEKAAAPRAADGVISWGGAR